MNLINIKISTIFVNLTLKGSKFDIKMLSEFKFQALGIRFQDRKNYSLITIHSLVKKILTALNQHLILLEYPLVNKR